MQLLLLLLRLLLQSALLQLLLSAQLQQLLLQSALCRCCFAAADAAVLLQRKQGRGRMKHGIDWGLVAGCLRVCGGSRRRPLSRAAAHAVAGEGCDRGEVANGCCVVGAGCGRRLMAAALCTRGKTGRRRLLQRPAVSSADARRATRLSLLLLLFGNNNERGREVAGGCGEKQVAGFACGQGCDCVLIGGAGRGRRKHAAAVAFFTEREEGRALSVGVAGGRMTGCGWGGLTEDWCTTKKERHVDLMMVALQRRLCTQPRKKIGEAAAVVIKGEEEGLVRVL